MKKVVHSVLAASLLLTSSPVAMAGGAYDPHPVYHRNCSGDGCSTYTAASASYDTATTSLFSSGVLSGTTSYNASLASTTTTVKEIGGTAASAASSKASSWLSSVMGSIGAAYSKWLGGGGGGGLFGGFSSALGSIGSSISSAVGSIGSSISSAVGSVGSSISSVTGSIGSSITSSLGSVGSSLTSSLGSLGSSVTDAVNSAVDKVTGAVTGAFTAVTAQTAQLQGQINGLLSGSLSKISQVQALGGVPQHIEYESQPVWGLISGGWGGYGWTNQLAPVDYTAKLNGLVNESGEALKAVSSYEAGFTKVEDLSANLDSLQATMDKIKGLPESQKANVTAYVDVNAIEAKIKTIKEGAGEVSQSIDTANKAAAAAAAAGG